MIYLSAECDSITERQGLHIYPWRSRRSSIGGRLFWRWRGVMHCYSLRYSGTLKKWRFRRRWMTEEEEARNRAEMLTWRNRAEA